MGGKPRLIIREVLASADSAVARGHALVRRTFPKQELVDESEWRHSLREGEADLWTDIRWHLVVAERDSRILGIATGTYLGNVNIGVIGYLAVAHAARGLGLGPRLRAKLRSAFGRDARQIHRKPLQAVVGEVRRDNPWLHILVRTPRVLPLDFAYLQPRLHRGGRTVPLVFYYESLDRIRRSLSTKVLRKLLYTIWRRIYRISRPLSDPAFRSMLLDLAGRRSVGRLSLPKPPRRGRRS